MPEIKDELLEAKPEKEIKRHKYYSNKTELGLTHANGNSNYQTYNFKTRNFYRYNKQFLIFGGHYTYGEANSLLNSQNWDFNLSYYYKLTSNFASVIGGTVEGNRFQELKRRENTDIAGKYYFIKGKIQKLNLQVGYRYTIENFYGDTDHLVQHKGRVLLSWKNKLSKNLATEAVVDYIPNFSTKV